MKKIIPIIVFLGLFFSPLFYFSSKNTSIMCGVFGSCKNELIDKSKLVMKATAKSIIEKSHPTTNYQKHDFKKIEENEKEFLAVYEITYKSVIEGVLYMDVDVVFDKNNLDFIEIRRKSDTSKMPILDIDFSFVKELIIHLR